MKSDTNVLELSLQSVPQKLRVTGGAEISFSRAFLSIRNTGHAAVVGFVPHATFSQEGGSVQDVSEALSKSNSMDSIPPGKAAAWDVYDLLLAGHPGVASKVHLWGYKAILNWQFNVAVWAEYKTSKSDLSLHTPVSRWTIRWTAAKTALDVVDLIIEAVND